MLKNESTSITITYNALALKYFNSYLFVTIDAYCLLGTQLQ